MKIIITGNPGVGKTTLIKSILSNPNIHSRAAGFYTEEIRNNGSRIGFKLLTLDGEEGIFAHIGFNTPYRVGKYGVDINCLEKIGVSAIEHGLKSETISLIVIDELGKMELFSKKFKEIVLKTLASSKSVLATMGKISHPFLDEIRTRADIKVFTLNINNRNLLAQKILDMLK